MSKKQLDKSTMLAPVPVVLVSCGNMEDSNITTVAWTGIINSDPPLVYISLRPSRYSYDIITNTKEFVINIPNEKLVYETDFCGIKSGKEIDKFNVLKLTKERTNIVEAPLIAECPINLECKLIEVKKLGTHDMLIGEILSCNIDNIYLDDKGSVDYSKLSLISYMGSDYYIVNKKVGYKGMSLK